MNPLVSVIIPTFNRRELVGRALRSVLAQTGVSFETIVVDDGSTDGTEERVRAEFPAVTFIYQTNQGPSAARNTAIKIAKGEWIAFLDSDDEWLPGKLQAQIDYFKRHPDVLIHQTEEIWIRNGRRVNPMKKHKKSAGLIFEKCLHLCLISPSAVMMHRSLFDELGLFDESFPACEDYDLWLRVTPKQVVGLTEKSYVVKYGGHADQRSHEFPAMDQFRIRALGKILRSGMLSEAQAEAAQEVLKSKMEIYVAGALKRGKIKEAEEIQQACPL